MSTKTGCRCRYSTFCWSADSHRTLICSTLSTPSSEPYWPVSDSETRSDGCDCLYGWWTPVASLLQVMLYANYADQTAQCPCIAAIQEIDSDAELANYKAMTVPAAAPDPLCMTSRRILCISNGLVQSSPSTTFCSCGAR